MMAIRLAGLLLIGGALIFFLGAALPTWRVYVTHDPGMRAQLIRDLQPAWALSHLLFLLGATATALGFAVFASTVEDGRARLVALFALAAVVAAGIAWAYIVVAFRLTLPPEVWVRSGDGPWAFPAYALLTLVGMLLWGVALLWSGTPSWLGVVTIGLSGLLLAAFVIQRDAIPASFYVPSLIAGTVFLFHES